MTLSIMKRLITIILILAMIMPAAVCAEEQDPIIGTWYINFRIKGSPMESDLSEFDTSIMLITFSETSSIYLIELDYSGSKLTNNGLNTIGKWEKTGTGYELSIISVGISNAVIQDGMLNAAIYNTGIYMKYRRLEEFNFYTEMYRK